MCNPTGLRCIIPPEDLNEDRISSLLVTMLMLVLTRSPVDVRAEFHTKKIIIEKYVKVSC